METPYIFKVIKCVELGQCRSWGVKGGLKPVVAAMSPVEPKGRRKCFRKGQPRPGATPEKALSMVLVHQAGLQASIDQDSSPTRS